MDDKKCDVLPVWDCPEHGYVCDREQGHEGEHRCVFDVPDRPTGWSNAAKARANDTPGVHDEYGVLHRDY
jgi:hypothetical protein